MKLARALAATIVAALPLASPAQNLVVNGSFEADAPNANYWKITPTLTGWTGFPDIELRNNYDGVAQDGINFVELDTYYNSAMTQEIHATGLVELTFWYGLRPYIAAGTSALHFSLGNLSGTLLETEVGTATTEWRKYTGIADLGQSGTATLRFEALGVSDQYGGSLDNVSITAVPEPRSAVLMLAGLGLLSASMLRRAHPVRPA